MIELFYGDTMDPMNVPEKTPLSTPIAPPASRFPQFCGFVRTYEGANPANNNPYNEKYYYGGYLPKYGVVKKSVGGFAMFSTLALGEEYGETCIMERIMANPEWTYLDFFMVFSPPSDDNDTVKYASTIAAEIGVESSANLKTTLNL